MKIQSFFYSTVLLIFLFSVSCDNEQNTGDLSSPTDGANYVYVISNSSLVLRAKPTTDSVKLGIMPSGTRVKILRQSEETMTIDGLTAPWIQVDFNGKTGWAFGGYLSRTHGGTPLTTTDPATDTETAEADGKPKEFSKAMCPAYKTCVSACDDLELPYDATDPDGTARVTSCVADCDNEYGLDASELCE